MYVSSETLWGGLAAIVSALVAIGGAFMWLGRLGGRVTSLEMRMRERDEERQQERVDRDRLHRDLETSISALRGQMQIFGDGLGASREAALERFAPIAQLQSLDRKIDGLSTRLGGLETSQAEIKATLRGVLDRRGGSIP